jgi:hypothetical protein
MSVRVHIVVTEVDDGADAVFMMKVPCAEHA